MTKLMTNGLITNGLITHGLIIPTLMLLTLPLAAQAQEHGEQDQHAMQHTDHAAMHHGEHATDGSEHAAMQGGNHAGHGSDHGATAPDEHTMDHGATKHNEHTMPDTAHDDMPHHRQEAAPSPRRSPDYSDGIAASGMAHHLDLQHYGIVRFDRLEVFDSEHARGQAWEMDAWYGGDINRFGLRSEGSHTADGGTGGSVELLWSHAVAPFWNAELGLRHDFGPGPGRDWLGVGIAGLAPYFFDVRATAWLGPGGRTALELSAAYEVRFTQRLILEPEIETSYYGQADPARGIDSGLGPIEAGVRLRYEIHRKFAPYLGVVWERHDGRTSRRWVAGVRLWLP